MSKTLISGIGAMIASALVGFFLPALGLNVDISVLEDGAVTVADLLLVAGMIGVGISAPYIEHIKEGGVWSKALVGGTAAAIIAAITGVLLPALGLAVDLGPLTDGEITLADLVSLAGTILVSVSQPVIENVQSVAWINTKSKS